MNRANTRRWSRRQFLKDTVARAGVFAVAPSIIPASALGKDGFVSPSDRLVMGTIGLGGRGRYVMGAFMENAEVQMVGVCDVQGKRRADGQSAVNEK